MRADTFDHTIRALLDRRPFVPFVVALTSGDRIEIDRPDEVVVRGGKAGYLGPGVVLHLFDHSGVSHIVGDAADPSIS